MARDGDGAVGLVGAVLADAVDKVLGGGVGDGDDGAQVHEQAAVAVQHHHPLVGPAQGQAQGVGRTLSHGAGEGVVEVAGRDVDPLLGRLVHRHHDLVGPVARQHFEAFVSLHHQIGSRPINMATGLNSV